MAEIGTRRAFAAAADTLQKEANDTGEPQQASHKFKGYAGTMKAYPNNPDQLTYTVFVPTGSDTREDVIRESKTLSRKWSREVVFPISVSMQSVTSPGTDFLTTKEMASSFLREMAAATRRQLFWGGVGAGVAVALYFYGKSK